MYNVCKVCRHVCSVYISMLKYITLLVVHYTRIYYYYYIGIVTVLVGNTRKAVTIVLSFLLFAKPGSILYLLGSVFVFGSLIGNAIMKESLYSGGAGGGGGGGSKGKGDLTKNTSFGGV